MAQHVHETMAKFGYPDTAVSDYAHWAVLVRVKQVTLGSLVLVCKEPAEAFSEVSRAALTELHDVTSDLESALSDAFSFDRINYLMLMMVDPHVHFHVIPRYAAPRELDGERFEDDAWPGPPDLKRARDLDARERERLIALLRDRWPKR